MMHADCPPFLIAGKEEHITGLNASAIFVAIVSTAIVLFHLGVAEGRVPDRQLITGGNIARRDETQIVLHMDVLLLPSGASFRYQPTVMLLNFSGQPSIPSRLMAKSS